MRRWMLGSFVALALVTGGCSDGDEGRADDGENEEESDEEGSGTREDYIAAFMPGISTMGVTEDEAECIAGTTVDVVGLEKLNEVTSPSEVERGEFGFAGFELDETAGQELYDGMNTCVDFFELLIAAGQPPEMVDCLRQNVTDEMLRDAMVVLFTRPENVTDDAAMALNEAVNACTPDTLPTTTPATPPVTAAS